MLITYIKNKTKYRRKKTINYKIDLKKLGQIRLLTKNKA